MTIAMFSIQTHHLVVGLSLCFVTSASSLGVEIPTRIKDEKIRNYDEKKLDEFQKSRSRRDSPTRRMASGT